MNIQFKINNSSILLKILGLFVCSGSFAQPQNEYLTLFGVPLTGKGKEIVEIVEKQYGKKIQEEYMFDESPTGLSGNSKVSDDGTPIIFINPKTGKNVGTILHELYHFIQRSEGYPVIEWLYPKSMDNESNRKSVNLIRQLFYDPILHYTFFDTLRSLGFNPNVAFEVGTKELINNETIQKAFLEMDEGAAALYFYNISLNLKDQELFQRLKRELIAQNKTQGIIRGERLSNVIYKIRPRNPQLCIQALVECLNLFYYDQYSFKEQRWYQRQLGNHNQVIVQIELQKL